MSLQSYRADVDGLRAIAVLFVVHYHSFSAGFNAGQINVVNFSLVR